MDFFIRVKFKGGSPESETEYIKNLKNVIIVRHGQGDHNVSKMTTPVDTPLNDIEFNNPY